MRILNIIELFYHSNTYITTQDIAHRFQVTTRTIQNDVKTLSKDGANNGFLIRYKRGEGYALEIKDDQKFQKYIASWKYDSYGNPNQRMEDIIVLLLCNYEFITQEFLSKTFNLSISQIKQDINKIKNELNHSHILLETKPHYGIRVLADLEKRIALLEKFYKNKNRYLLSKCDDIWKKSFIEQEIIQILKEKSIDMNYSELEQLYCFLKMLLVCKKNETECSLDATHNFLEAACKISECMEQKFVRSLSVKEIETLSKFLQRNSRQTSNHYKEQDTACFLKEALTKLEQQFHYKFTNNQIFMKNLLSHLNFLLDRLHQRISFQNPLLDEISVKFPIVLDIAICFAKQIETKYQMSLTQDEIGFLATHFAYHMEEINKKQLETYARIAVVCSSGGGSAYLIKLKLASIFYKSEIQTFSFFEKEELLNYQPNVIFSITNLDYIKDIPVIRIREILDDQDILKIKQLMQFNHPNIQILNCLQEDHFYIIEKEENYREILKRMSEKIEIEGYAGPYYSEYVLQREEYLSTIYHNGVAIPHPIMMCGKKNLISIAIIKHPIQEQGKQVRIIFMVSLKKQDIKLHEQITNFIFHVMNDLDKLQKLWKVNSFQELVRTIHMLERKISNDD